MIHIINAEDSQIGIEYKTFSDGAQHVKALQTELIRNSNFFGIDAIILSSNELVNLMMVVDILRRYGLPRAEIHLRLRYLPYARQDRVCNDGEALSIAVLANILNNLKFDSVEIWDPHSDVGPALLERVIIKTQYELFDYHLTCNPKLSSLIIDAFILSPDSGALKKTEKFCKHFGGLSMVTATKTRNTATLELTDTVIHCDDFNGNNVTIIDDICDGGRTFQHLAVELKKKNVGEINLYVTHGLFSYGLDALKDFSSVYVANDLRNNNVFSRVL
jgi:ribose-phosphate pyrophosphokinase